MQVLANHAGRAQSSLSRWVGTTEGAVVQILEEAERKVQILTKDASGKLTEAEFAGEGDEE